MDTKSYNAGRNEIYKLVDNFCKSYIAELKKDEKCKDLNETGREMLRNRISAIQHLQYFLQDIKDLANKQNNVKK